MKRGVTKENRPSAETKGLGFVSTAAAVTGSLLSHSYQSPFRTTGTIVSNREMDRIIAAFTPGPVDDPSDLIDEGDVWVTPTQFGHGGVDVVPGVEPHRLVTIRRAPEFLSEDVHVSFKSIAHEQRVLGGEGRVLLLVPLIAVASVNLSNSLGVVDDQHKIVSSFCLSKHGWWPFAFRISQNR
jgi:hypothetical protein